MAAQKKTGRKKEQNMKKTHNQSNQGGELNVRECIRILGNQGVSDFINSDFARAINQDMKDNPEKYTSMPMIAVNFYNAGRIDGIRKKRARKKKNTL